MFVGLPNKASAALAPWVLSALVLVGCAETQLVVHAAKEITNNNSRPSSAAATKSGKKTGDSVPIGTGGVYKVGDPYVVAGVRYVPKVDPDYNKTGIASWYGKPFHGRRTANGEIYDMDALTAAHKTLPMPVNVRVTNLENGRTLMLRVNDRGPFVNGRIIDVSRRGAELLGFANQGTAKVRVEITGAQAGGQRIAKGKTTQEEKNSVRAAPIGTVQVAALAPPPGLVTAPSPKVLPQVPSGEVTKSAVTKIPDMFIQSGAFTIYENALKQKAFLSGITKTKITSVIVNGKEFFRVRVGPLKTVAQADDTLARMIDGGYTNSRIVID